VLALEMQHKWSSVPFLWSPVVDKETTELGEWLESVPCVSFST